MAFPSLPALAFVVKSVAGATLTLWLDALKSAIDSTTDDASVSKPANALWVTSSHATATLTDAVYAVPAASSPIAGKVVLIWAGAAAVSPNSSAMASPDTTAANTINFGMWVATAGNTVSAADYSAWDAAAPFTGAGRFTGYVKLEASLATIQDCFAFISAEYILTQLMTTTATSSYACWGGAGIRGLSDSAVNGESGLGGRLFDFGCSGSGAVISSALFSASSSQALFTHSPANAQQHHYILVPGSTAIRAIRYKDASTASAFNNSTSNNCIGLDGSMIKPGQMAFRDNNDNYAGDHRAIFYGPRKMTKSVLSDSGTKKWLAFGHSVTTQGDCVVLPM